MASSFRSVKLDQRAVDALLTRPNREVGRHLARLGTFVSKAGRELASQRLERRSGEYEDGFTTTTRREAGGLRTVVTNRARHATYIEAGTRPHIIVPRRGSVLVFQGRDGTTVFARQVHHPGTRSYHVLRDALRIGIRRAR